MNILEFLKSDTFSLILSLLGYLIAVVLFLFRIRKAKKDGKIEKENKDKAILKQMLTENIIPLMEQAEITFNDPTEKDNWVIKKLSELTHIDFYKYKDILEIAENIIADICKTTKINVNKIKVVEAKEETKEEKEELTNGVF